MPHVHVPSKLSDCETDCSGGKTYDERHLSEWHGVFGRAGTARSSDERERERERERGGVIWREEVQWVFERVRACCAKGKKGKGKSTPLG